MNPNIKMNITKTKTKNYKKFSKKDKALQSVNYDTQNIYGLDNSSINATKTFVVSNDETIFGKIINGDNFYYENIEKNQEIAFGLDMDITTLNEDATKKEIDDYLLIRFEKIINFFKDNFKIDLTIDNNFLITKSKYCPKKKKHSFHVKVLGYKFPCPYVVKHYFKQMHLTEEKDGVDSSVYRTGLIRLSFCTKKGQKRPLEPYWIGDEEPKWFYELNNNIDKKLTYFTNSKWTFVNNYEDVNITEYLDILEKKEKKNLSQMNNKTYPEGDPLSDKNIKNASMYDLETLGKLLEIINVERFSNEFEWKKLLWILKNQDFDCFDLFDKISSEAEKYPGRTIVKNIWDKAEKYKYPYTIATLFFWAKIDNPIVDECKFDNVFFKFRENTERFEPLHINEIIKKNSIDPEEQDLQVIDKNKTIRSILMYMNKFFIKLKNLKGKIVFLEQRGRTTIIRDKKNFLDLLEDCNIKFKYTVETNDELKIVDYPFTKENDIRNAGRLWISSPFKKDYQNITFYPDENKAFYDTYNMFKGIDLNFEMCKNINENEDVQPLKDHILNIWCKGKQDVYEYTIKLLAFYLQNLHIKSGVAIVISGDKGTGKSCIIEKSFRYLWRLWEDCSKIRQYFRKL